MSAFEMWEVQGGLRPPCELGMLYDTNTLLTRDMWTAEFRHSRTASWRIGILPFDCATYTNLVTQGHPYRPEQWLMIDPAICYPGWYHPDVRYEQLTQGRRDRYFYERYIAGFDTRTRVDPVKEYAPWELQQLREQSYIRGAHRVSQLFQGREPAALGVFDAMVAGLRHPELAAWLPGCVPISHARAEAQQRQNGGVPISHACHAPGPRAAPASAQPEAAMPALADASSSDDEEDYHAHPLPVGPGRPPNYRRPPGAMAELGEAHGLPLPTCHWSSMVPHNNAVPRAYTHEEPQGLLPHVPPGSTQHDEQARLAPSAPAASPSSAAQAAAIDALEQRMLAQAEGGENALLAMQAASIAALEQRMLTQAETQDRSYWATLEQRMLTQTETQDRRIIDLTETVARQTAEHTALLTSQSQQVTSSLAAMEASVRSTPPTLHRTGMASRRDDDTTHSMTLGDEDTADEEESDGEDGRAHASIVPASSLNSSVSTPLGPATQRALPHTPSTRAPRASRAAGMSLEARLYAHLEPVVRSPGRRIRPELVTTSRTQHNDRGSVRASRNSSARHSTSGRAGVPTTGQPRQPIVCQWLQGLLAQVGLRTHERQYLDEFQQNCVTGHLVVRLPELRDEWIKGELETLRRGVGQRRFFPSPTIAYCQHMFFSAHMVITPSAVVAGEHGFFLRPGHVFPAMRFFYMGLVVDLPTRRKPGSHDLAVEDGDRAYIVNGRVPNQGAHNETIVNWPAKANEFIHGPASRNAIQFAESGTCVSSMLSNATGMTNVEVFAQYDDGDPDQHYDSQYNWDGAYVYLVYRVAQLLYRMAVRIEREPSDFQFHYAAVLDVVCEQSESGRPNLRRFRRIIADEVRRVSPVEATVALIVQVVLGLYDVSFYFPTLADGARNRSHVAVERGSPASSMLPHILFRLGVFREHVQFRVADHPEHPVSEYYIDHWDAALVDYAGRVDDQGWVAGVNEEDAHLRQEIENMMEEVSVSRGSGSSEGKESEEESDGEEDDDDDHDGRGGRRGGSVGDGRGGRGNDRDGRDGGSGSGHGRGGAKRGRDTGGGGGDDDDGDTRKSTSTHRTSSTTRHSNTSTPSKGASNRSAIHSTYGPFSHQGSVLSRLSHGSSRGRTSPPRARTPPPVPASVGRAARSPSPAAHRRHPLAPCLTALLCPWWDGRSAWARLRGTSGAAS
jgi:hypothetical protein